MPSINVTYVHKQQTNEWIEWTQWHQCTASHIDIASVATVVGAHFVQYVQPLFGLIITIAVGFQDLVLGNASVGQCLAGFGIGVIVHIYVVFTPLFMRPIDFLLNLLGGSLVFTVVKGYYETDDFTFAIDFLNGAAWMVRCYRGHSVAVIHVDYSINAPPRRCL